MILLLFGVLKKNRKTNEQKKIQLTKVANRYKFYLQKERIASPKNEIAGHEISKILTAEDSLN